VVVVADNMDVKSSEVFKSRSVTSAVDSGGSSVELESVNSVVGVGKNG
jgi:hypothetical protein